jgi:hypothetical protein
MTTLGTAPGCNTASGCAAGGGAVVCSAGAGCGSTGGVGMTGADAAGCTTGTGALGAREEDALEASRASLALTLCTALDALVGPK